MTNELLARIGLLEQENNQLKEQNKELRSWLEKEVSTFGGYRYEEVLNKLNELEGKNE